MLSMRKEYCCQEVQGNAQVTDSKIITIVTGSERLVHIVTKKILLDNAFILNKELLNYYLDTI